MIEKYHYWREDAEDYLNKVGFGISAQRLIQVIDHLDLALRTLEFYAAKRNMCEKCGSLFVVAEDTLKKIKGE